MIRTKHNGALALILSATGSDTAEQIQRWVVTTFAPRQIDGVTVYDLSAIPNAA